LWSFKPPSLWYFLLALRNSYKQWKEILGRYICSWNLGKHLVLMGAGQAVWDNDMKRQRW
jgi:hypothetical protein